MYEFESRVRFSESSLDGHLRLDALFNYFQDCGSFEGESLSRAKELLKEKDLAWIVNYYQLDIKRMPRTYEKIVIGTNPYKFRAFMGRRNFYIKGEGEETLAQANSVWSLIQLKEEKLYRISPELSAQYPLGKPLDMEYTSRKIFYDKDQGEKCPSLPVTPLMVDSNGHMNNVQYLRLAELFIPQDLPIKRIRIEYKKQAFPGNWIHPVIRKKSPFLISLDSEDQDPYCLIEITAKA